MVIDQYSTIYYLSVSIHNKPLAHKEKNVDAWMPYMQVIGIAEYGKSTGCTFESCATYTYSF